MSARPEMTTDLVVAGAGPVGMLAALAAAERGLRVRIVDPYRRAALHSYALALHPASLRLLEEYGIAERLVARGCRVRWIDVFLGPERVTTLDVSAIGGPYPFVLVLPQAMLEGALEQRLSEVAVEVEWGRAVLSFDTTPRAVSVLVAEVPGSEAAGEVRAAPLGASYLIGADGADSPVRRVAGFPIEHHGAPLEYGLLEFESVVEAPDRMALVFGERSTDVLWPLGPERARWGLQLAGAAHEPDAPALWSVLGERAPWFSSAGCRTEWVTSVAFRPGVSRRFGRDRVWLAGDAAHVTSPVAVQSMNVGLREGHDLARRVAAVLAGEHAPKLLLYYHEDREREWRMLLGVHDRLRAEDGAPRWARGVGRRLVSALPASGAELNALLGQVGLRLHWLRGRRRAAAGSGPADGR